MKKKWTRFVAQYKSLKVLLYLRRELNKAFGGDPDRIRSLMDACQIVYDQRETI